MYVNCAFAVIPRMEPSAFAAVVSCQGPRLLLLMQVGRPMFIDCR